ncbi:hypothetical protein EX895_006602 [Sporisorium graminicola]|uniref:Cation/H+ exchanger transmembrane domain-containing protein n=1 Tax=Sporisorium graminicola TaxID=280036 RepID=A0A4U7KKQ8_9BASI|nr:hypothetical protein EX895_006602 [Sporisorium graminicola]TKY84700.1 hypothetical protein EX895_006602 [Sporisorium graminicola]
MGAPSNALPYTAPSLVVILILASYLLLLTVFYHGFQWLFSAGIIGPLVLGAIYARPLGNILPEEVQSAVLAIGYLGLLLLIVQGGLESRMDILSSPKNLAMAFLVGTTGIIMPIGISMALLPLGFGFGYLESFAVGSALASTSLGTTFAVLNTFNGASSPAAAEEEHDGSLEESGIANTRIGTILVGAALLDDIIGLVITSVIVSLGSSTTASVSEAATISSIAPWTIARPIVSSFLLILVSWLLTQFALAPLGRRFIIPVLVRAMRVSRAAPLDGGSSAQPRLRVTQEALKRLHDKPGLQQLIATTLLVSLVLAYCVISEEIGSSNLIGAFCAGAVMKYLYSLYATLGTSGTGPNDHKRHSWSPDFLLSSKTALGVVQDTILVPFFFSSIGSAVPVKSMFEGKTVWRGVIFAGLMAFAKVCGGAWVLLADVIERQQSGRLSSKQKLENREQADQVNNDSARTAASMEMQPRQEQAASGPLSSPSAGGAGDAPSDNGSSVPVVLQQPLVWPAALFLGTALMSRGEIGFLIVNVANQGGLIGQEAFNVGIWAITLNTLAGPMAIGILMRSQHGLNILGRAPNSHLGRWS